HKRGRGAKNDNGPFAVAISINNFAGIYSEAMQHGESLLVLVFTMSMPVMFQQSVFAKIVFEVSDHGVNMICIILGIVVFDNSCWAVNAVIAGFSDSSLLISGPCKPEIFHTGVFNILQHFARQFLFIAIQVNFQES